MFIWVDGGGARRPPRLWRRQLRHLRRRCCCRCHRSPPPPPPPSSPPLRHVTLGEGARERADNLKDWVIGRVNIERRRKKGLKIMASCVGDARFLREKQPKAKIRRCSRMGNFFPHAAASPKSVREYEYIVYSCTIGDDWGGRGLLAFLADQRASGDLSFF